MQETWVWILESGRSPGEGNGNPLQYSSLENPMDGGVCQATVHGVTKIQTWLSSFTIICMVSKEDIVKNSLVVQWLGLGPLSARDPGSVTGQGSKILQAFPCPKNREGERELIISSIRWIEEASLCWAKNSTGLSVSSHFKANGMVEQCCTTQSSLLTISYPIWIQWILEAEEKALRNRP